METKKNFKGYDTKDVKSKGIAFTVYDVAGSEKLRELWRHYYEKKNAVVWFIDSADAGRFDESKAALEFVLKDPTLPRDIPILVLGNKSDLSGSKSEDEIKSALNLENLLKGRTWTVMKANSKSGEGINEALLWLTKEIKAEHKKRKNEDKQSKKEKK